MTQSPSETIDPSLIRAGLLSAAASSSPVAVFAVDVSGRVLFAEGGGVRWLAGGRAQIDGLSVVDAWGDTPPLVAAIGEALGGTRYAGEIRAGERRFDVRVVPLFDSARRVHGAAGLAVETAPAEVDANGRGVTRILAALVESLPMSVWVLDQRGDVVRDNSLAREHGPTAIRTARERDTKGANLVGRVLLEGRESRGVARVRAADGAPFDLAVRGIPLQGENGSTVGAILMAAAPEPPPAPPSLPLSLSGSARSALRGWTSYVPEAFAQA